MYIRPHILAYRDTISLIEVISADVLLKKDSDSDYLFTAFRPQARTSVHTCIKISNKNANTIIYNFSIPTT